MILYPVLCMEKVIDSMDEIPVHFDGTMPFSQFYHPLTLFAVNLRFKTRPYGLIEIAATIAFNFGVSRDVLFRFAVQRTLPSL